MSNRADAVREWPSQFIEMKRQDDIRRSAIDLLLVERAKGWLLEDGGSRDGIGSEIPV